jgi:hypothetical protein
MLVLHGKVVHSLRSPYIRVPTRTSWTGSNLGQQLLDKRRATIHDMIEALSRHDHLEVLDDFKKSKHAFLSPWQPCLSVMASVVTTLLVSMQLPSLFSQISLSLSRSYLSAATSKC